MGSGLIYAIIVVLWAIVLVPMWLRRHDAETESRSVDRFSSAMRVLSRRPGGRSRERGPSSVVVPPMSGSNEPIDLDAPAEGAERPAYVKPTRRPVTAPAPQVFVSRPAPRGAARAHRRRRTILLSLALLLVVAGAVFALGAVGLWLPIAAFAITAGYLALVMSRAAATRRAHEAQRRQQQREHRRGGIVAAPADWHDTVVLGREPLVAAASTQSDVIDLDARTNEQGWQPTPIPVPTYVNAPAATVLPREIDRRHDGAWDAQGMLDHAAAVRADADAMRSHEIDAHPTGDDVWTRATAAAGDRDAVFDREWFESDFDSTSAQELADDDAAAYLPRRRAVNE